MDSKNKAGSVELNDLREAVEGLHASEAIAKVSGLFKGRCVFTTSLGLEDQVITDMIFSQDLPVEVITLDTGRLFPETYTTLNETIKKYGKKIKLYFPGHEDVEKMVSEKGPFSFYYSVENRLECCHIRKTLPLARALEGADLWIAGIRADQSPGRQTMQPLEYDTSRKIYKYYPLFRWTLEEVRNYIKDRQVPYNPLHDKGFISIGCQPCTRAVAPGEDFRSGRWWWEEGSKKECGIHLKG